MTGLLEGLRVIQMGHVAAIPTAGSLLAAGFKNLGMDLQVTPVEKEPRKRGIWISLDDTCSLGEEGYELVITPKKVTLRSLKPAGLFYGVQTLLQLLPQGAVTDTVILPSGTIRDYPRYAYRGAMLDVARHFFKPADVKRFIDLMASYKMNYLHLHLADDQGWRIEIKSWPNLALHGGSTQVGGGAGGYYTQEEYAELVAYAQARHVTVVPEIDMPGHTNAALASYPELNCSGKAPALYTGTQVGFSTLCTNQEITYQFISDVFKELTALTPGPYLHMGGDESHVTRIEDYIPFVNRVHSIIRGYGKIPMGWDDIAVASLQPGTVAQNWAKDELALKAAAQGAKLVLSPARKAYLDMKYDSTTTLGLKWAGYIEVDTAYTWDPDQIVPGLDPKMILGIEAPLWSETVTNMKEIEYLVFPRLAGYAEIGWTPASLRSWEEYRTRLASHGKWMESMGIHFYRSPRIDWK